MKPKQIWVGCKLTRAVKRCNTYASSSIGRAAVSKTAGWGFDSLLACQHSSNLPVRIG